VDTYWGRSLKGAPTFLNLGRPFPAQPFRVVIWGSVRHRFGEPEKLYRGERICVTGTITQYEGKPQIVIRQPQQIRLEP
jgi:hypothetical protein